jgi:uncharacterized protein (DUF1778 family)
MAGRTALLVCCSIEEAQQIRNAAAMERRTVSNYVMCILSRVLAIEEALRTRSRRFQELNRLRSFVTVRPLGPRTAVLLRCSVEEANEIRAAAARRESTISGFVLRSLHRAWNARSAGHGYAPPVDFFSRRV